MARVIAGAGRWLLPAFVDLHAHLREPGQEYKEDIATGLAAAAAGGFAHVCAMPNTRPVNDTRAITEMMVARAEGVGGPELHPIGAITVGQKGQELTEMADLKDAGAVAVSDDGRCVTSSAVMRRALEYARTFDLPVIQHAEDHALTEGAQMHEGAVSTRLGLRGWPRVAEDIIVARDVLLAEVTGARYHVAHVSSLGAVRILREAKSRGLPVTAEVTPHHLLLTDAALIGYDTACKVNPPLRERTRTSPRCAPRSPTAPSTPSPPTTRRTRRSRRTASSTPRRPGMIGLETVLSALARPGAARARFRSAASSTRSRARPARVVGIDVPTLSEGVPAALVHGRTREHAGWSDRARLRSKSANTPFLGREVAARCALTMSEGAVIFDATE